MIVFFPNNRESIWLEQPPEPLDQLLARIRSGEWQPPPDVAEKYNIRPGQTFCAQIAAGMIIVRPSFPRAQLTPDQVEVMRRVLQGKTGRQIARELGRSTRWVYRQAAAAKRALREAASRPPQPDGE